MPKPTKLPKWVFDNLEAYENCALPNECMEWNRAELKAYLEKHTGMKITLREAEFSHCEDFTITKNKRKTKYIIAEVIHE